MEMNVKQYLGQMKNIEKRIKDKLLEAESWRLIAQGTTVGNNPDKVQTSPSYDKMGDAVAQAIDYEQESLDLAKRLTELKHTITKQIDGMADELHYNILKTHYIQGKSLMEIAVIEHYSYKQLKRHYDEALIEFEKMYKNQFVSVIMSTNVHKCP